MPGPEGGAQAPVSGGAAPPGTAGAFGTAAVPPRRAPGPGFAREVAISRNADGAGGGDRLPARVRAGRGVSRTRPRGRRRPGCPRGATAGCFRALISAFAARSRARAEDPMWAIVRFTQCLLWIKTAAGFSLLARSRRVCQPLFAF
ncbi:hypothetical protein GCM10027174_05960 [Salinifilum aidingensis]